MRVALTGATGFIGSRVLQVLRQRGHDVTALVRDEAHVSALEAKGSIPVIVDLTDRAAVTNVLDRVDAAIHTASPGDATSAEVDAAMVDAATASYVGTQRPYVHTSGLWVYGANQAISEQSPLDPPALVAWKQPIFHTPGEIAAIVPAPRGNASSTVVTPTTRRLDRRLEDSLGVARVGRIVTTWCDRSDVRCRRQCCAGRSRPGTG